MKKFKYFLFGLLLVVIFYGFMIKFDHNSMPYGEMIVVFVALLLAFAGIMRNKNGQN